MGRWQREGTVRRLSDTCSASLPFTAGRPLIHYPFRIHRTAPPSSKSLTEPQLACPCPAELKLTWSSHTRAREWRQQQHIETRPNNQAHTLVTCEHSAGSCVGLSSKRSFFLPASHHSLAFISVFYTEEHSTPSGCSAFSSSSDKIYLCAQQKRKISYAHCEGRHTLQICCTNILFFVLSLICAAISLNTFERLDFI